MRSRPELWAALAGGACLLAWGACMALMLTQSMSDLLAPVGRAMGWYPRSFAVVLGDLDGDGDLDAYVANGHTDDRGEEDTVWLNDGTGRFADSGQRLGDNTYDSRTVALGDLDGDGDLDAFVGNHNGYSTVWLNDGRGRMSSNGQELYLKEPVNGRLVAMGLYNRSVALGDVDADGDLDAFVANCFGASYNLVWLNDGDGTFSDSGQYLGPLQSRAVALGDVDGDGDLDAVVANGHAPYLGEPNKVWLNDGRGMFADSGQRLGHPAFNSDDSRAIALADLDSDGDLDAFFGNDGPDEVWLNDGSGAFSHSGQNLGNARVQVLYLEDLDGDGDRDAFVGKATTAEVWVNDGAGTFAQSGQSIGYSDRDVVALGDVDGDGDQDVLQMNYDRGYCVWRSDGTGRFLRDSPRGKGLCWLVGGLGVIVPGLLGWWAIRQQRKRRSGEEGG